VIIEVESDETFFIEPCAGFEFIVEIESEGGAERIEAGPPILTLQVSRLWA
jgi:hypothetical protein